MDTAVWYFGAIREVIEAYVSARELEGCGDILDRNKVPKNLPAVCGPELPKVATLLREKSELEARVSRLEAELNVANEFGSSVRSMP